MNQMVFRQKMGAQTASGRERQRDNSWLEWRPFYRGGALIAQRGSGVSNNWVSTLVKTEQVFLLGFVPNYQTVILQSSTMAIRNHQNRKSKTEQNKKKVKKTGKETVH